MEERRTRDVNRTRKPFGVILLFAVCDSNKACLHTGNRSLRVSDTLNVSVRHKYPPYETLFHPCELPPHTVCVSRQTDKGPFIVLAYLFLLLERENKICLE